MQMEVVDFRKLEGFTVDKPGFAGVVCREVFTPDNGAPTYSMRVFEVQPGGNTALHRHDYEHEVFVLEGEGDLVGEAAAVPLMTGRAVLVEPDRLHQMNSPAA
jgi:quercetin dioxygenase-like cupin family protein